MPRGSKGYVNHVLLKSKDPWGDQIQTSICLQGIIFFMGHFSSPKGRKEGSPDTPVLPSREGSQEMKWERGGPLYIVARLR